MRNPVILPRSMRRGPQLAGWSPTATGVAGFKVRAECDVPIPLADRTVLRGDVYRPDTDQPRPVLLGWSPYQKDLMPTGLPAPFNEPGDVRHLARRGYVVAVVNARGTARSGGTLQPMLGAAEIDDLCEVIAWLATRPWSNGRVGMTGMSYFAISQLFAAARRPPALAAVAPFGAATDLYRMVLTHAGVPHPGFLGRYAALNGAVQGVRLPPNVRHALGYVVGTRPAQALIRAVISRQLSRLTRRARPPQSWLDRWVDLQLDSGVDRPDVPAPDMERIAVPVLIGSEWSMVGLHLFGAFDAWHRISGEKRMFIGPRRNDWPFTRYQDEILAWYDRFLCGVDNGVDALPPVRYWLHGAERWENAADWPAPDAGTWRLFLTPTACGGLADTYGGLAATPPAAGGTTRWWAAIPTGMECPGAFIRSDRQVLRYLTEPLPREAHLAGPAHLTLRLASTAPDTYLQARLSTTGPVGSPARVLSVGWLRAAHRIVDDSRTTSTEIVHDHERLAPLVPGEPSTVRFSLAPFAEMVPAGARLLLELGSDPSALAAPADQGYVYFATAGPPYPARNTVGHGGTEPSRLDLTVRGATPW
ncbi:CocE/NonD family hydrolase [Micromonospora arborensis]|uniref:CocE/NonD family hydrolase n=1 Tax=Micromonospora arborensis TaxID=2116518 RepID=UPI0033C1F0A5